MTRKYLSFMKIEIRTLSGGCHDEVLMVEGTRHAVDLIVGPTGLARSVPPSGNGAADLGHNWLGIFER